MKRNWKWLFEIALKNKIILLYYPTCRFFSLSLWFHALVRCTKRANCKLHVCSFFFENRIAEYGVFISATYPSFCMLTFENQTASPFKSKFYGESRASCCTPAALRTAARFTSSETLGVNEVLFRIGMNRSSLSIGADYVLKKLRAEFRQEICFLR